jgi:hypothetical protein
MLVAATASLIPGSPAVAQTPASGPPAATSADAAANGDLPVSLDRIRDALKKSDAPILTGLDRQADFRVEIEEKQKLEDLLKRLDVKAGPVPAGGLYMYEQNRMLFNPVDRPLMQPYAAFSGAELITIAIENLLGRYLGKPLLNAMSQRARTSAQLAAEEAVRRDIAAYCNARPDYMEIRLCNPDAR